MRIIRFQISLLLLPLTECLSCKGKLDFLWVWKGGLTSNHAIFKIGLRDSHKCEEKDIILTVIPRQYADNGKSQSIYSDCRFIYNADETLGTYAHLLSNAQNYRNVMSCSLSSLPYADRVYDYTLSIADHSDEKFTVIRSGTFTTPPVEGTPFTHRIAFSSCANEHSDPKVFSAIQSQKPFLFLHMGDLHYQNIVENKVERFRNAYDKYFESPAGRAMLEMDLPFAYMWDDHDFGPDNSDKTAPGRNAAVQAYRESVPHYELHALKGDGSSKAISESDDGVLYPPIYQAFTIGRVRYIITDLRSMRTPNYAPNMPSKTVLGPKQKAWFKMELREAYYNHSIKQIIWCSTMPWIDDERKWGHFLHEQQELVQFMQANGLAYEPDSGPRWIKPVAIVSGDAHMLAVDDGTHSPGNLVTFHAAALGRPGSIKGGPYSHGLRSGPGQFGILDVLDDPTEDRVCLHYRGMHMDDGVVLEYDTCHPERTPPVKPYFPPPIIVRRLLRIWRKIRKPFKNLPLFGSLMMAAIVFVVVYLFCKAYMLKNKRSKKD